MNGCNNISIEKSFPVCVFTITILFFLAVSIQTFGQLSVPGIPESFKISQKKNITLPKKTLQTINIERLLKEDYEKGIPNRYSVVQEININLRDSSIKTEIPGKGYIWQYEVQTVKAYSLGILFNSYHLPEGASIYIYTPDHNQVLGAFTSLNNCSLSVLSVADLSNNVAIIEYFEPYFPEFPGEIVLGSVSIAYRDIFRIFSDSGRIGINCPQGEDWQDDKHAVCRMTYRDTEGGYHCTGFMVNNVRKDLTPYFMTANHCINSIYSASTLIVYFNYENSGCYSLDVNSGQNLSGSTLIASNNNADFSLLLLNDVPPKIYSAYLAGWDATGRLPLSGVGIHHPSGTSKCISTSNIPFFLYDRKIQWDDNLVSKPFTHWLVKFSSGTTETGSSGSPIFDDNHRIIGQLHGGDDLSSLYSAFHISWEYNENNIYQLKHWLDPDNTGTKAIDGRYLYAMPQTEFSTINTMVCLNSTIKLTDKSKYEPSRWKWDISPSNFQFTNGTTDTSRNPDVVFSETGNFTVKLVTANQWGLDSLVKVDYLKVVSEINVKFQGGPSDNKICGCDLINFPFTATGANDYLFTFSRPEKADVIVSSNTANLSLIDNQKKFGDFNAELRVKGSIGTCEDADSIKLKIVMPVNDDIQNALFILPGNNGPFPNTCATGQTAEPYPAPLNCISNLYWCPGSTSHDIQNSIWFTFVGPENGKISVDTKGINDRIAIYEASSYQQIIFGRPITYNIVAANDDRSFLDASAMLENVNVSTDKQYWLQVESQDSDTGSVIISLFTNNFELFPNPSSGKFDVIISNSTQGIANIYIFSSTGNLIFSNEVVIAVGSNRFTIDISSNPSGLYYVQTRMAGSVFSSKIVLIH